MLGDEEEPTLKGTTTLSDPKGHVPDEVLVQTSRPPHWTGRSIDQVRRMQDLNGRYRNGGPN